MRRALILCGIMIVLLLLPTLCSAWGNPVDYGTRWREIYRDYQTDTTTISITRTAVTGTSVHLYDLSASADSAFTCTIEVLDGATTKFKRSYAGLTGLTVNFVIPIVITGNLTIIATGFQASFSIFKLSSGGLILHD